MEHSVILKCRVCLDEFEEEMMYELFKESRTGSGGKLKLSEKIEYCCGVRIRESVEMPTKICMKCFEMTRIWFTFRQMCVNSQVYLESLCKDRTKSSEITEENGEADNLEYLLEDLQTFRAVARHTNASFGINITDSSTARSDKDTESEEDCFDSLPLEVVDSDSDLEDILKNIKKETEEDQQEEQPKENTRKRRYNSQKKATSRFVSKKSRPPSPRRSLPSSLMCSICGNVYTKKSSFTYHMSLHSNVKPHECEICGKSFRQMCELKNHIRRHTGEKPYKCSYCDRHFIDRSEKHRHERVHTNTRPYTCKICGKSFMYSAILKNHNKLHSGEKDFNCLVCEKAFTLQHQLKAHLQTITHKQKETQFISAGYEILYE